MKSLVEIESQSLKRFVKEIKGINQGIRLATFLILSQALDHIRHTAADKYIIKNTVGKNMSPWKMAKLQPSQPSRLTERTGRMLQMMRHNPSWTGIKTGGQTSSIGIQTSSTAVQQGMGLRSRIAVEKVQRNVNETYIATIRANIFSSNPFIGKGFVGGGRILSIANGKIEREQKVETKDTLKARFIHEHGSSKHPKRQSFTPAAREEDIRLAPLFEARFNRILKAREKYGRS
jgi:hypothetical protein